MSGARAAFLDRDGTLIEDEHFLGLPELVRVIDGAADALRRLQAAEVSLIIVTNQSGIGRALITTAQYDAVARRVNELFAEEGVVIDAVYYCPDDPAAGPDSCRKPARVMYDRAIADHGLDAAASLFIGDRWRDVAPALTFGGCGVLVPSSETGSDDLAKAEHEAQVAPSLADAVSRFFVWGAR
jgi:histidinol-phosphate phosphatase family protein